MANGAKVVINLAPGLEAPERVTVAFLVGGAAAEQGKQVAMFLTKEAVRLAVPGVAEVVACDGCPAPRPPLRRPEVATGGSSRDIPARSHRRRTTLSRRTGGGEQWRLGRRVRRATERPGCTFACVESA